MAGQRTFFLAFNRGLVSALAAARADIKRIGLSAKTYLNFIPRVLGSMMVRPGLVYKGRTLSDALPRFIPFVFSVSDKALLELTDGYLTVWVNDAKITRPAVTTIINGFGPAMTGWTDNDEAGAVSGWSLFWGATFTGTGTNAAIRDQTVTLGVGSSGIEHAISVVVGPGEATFSVGSSIGADDYVAKTTLTAGRHSLAFTPTGTFYIRVSNRLTRMCSVGVYQEPTGIMQIPGPWVASGLDSIRFHASSDITYLASPDFETQQIERRGTRSWSVVSYHAESGPFRSINTTAVAIYPTQVAGLVRLIASAPIFSANHIGGMFAVTSHGTTQVKTVGALNDATDPVKCELTGTARAIAITIGQLTGTGDTIILERSYDSSTWVAVTGKTWVADAVENYNDTLDNQIIYYRLRCSVYAGGTPGIVISSGTGSQIGCGKVVGFNPAFPYTIDIDPILPFGGYGTAYASTDWYESVYSTFRGFPSSVAIAQGRLWLSGKGYICGSESDAYYSFNPSTTGDSASLVRTYGSGPTDEAKFLLPLVRLIVGGAAAEYTIRGSALDEPVTNATYNPKEIGQSGSANVQAIVVDKSGIFVQRGGTRIMSISSGSDIISNDYGVDQLSKLIPEIGEPGIVRMAVQRQPDVRVHFVRSDGTVAILVFDAVEQVSCFLNFSTSGLVKDVVVLPGDTGENEDHVYYAVQRTAGASTYVTLERWAYEPEAIGGSINKMADCAYVYSGAPVSGVSGLPAPLEGKQVVVWADGKDIGHDANDNMIFTVTGGAIASLGGSYSNIVVGLPYTAQWQSGKLMELQSAAATPLTRPKNVRGIGMVAMNLHPRGLKYGSDFSTMYQLPQVEKGRTIDPDAIRADYDEQTFEFPGTWDTDSRICLQGMAPRPANLLTLVAEVEMDSGAV